VSSSRVEIALMTPRDLPEYGDVIRRSFGTVANYFGWSRQIAPTFTAYISDDYLRAKIGDDYYPYGLYVDEVLCGFVSLTRSGDGEYELNNLSVLPNYRHRGYGYRLLEYCKHRVREFDGHKITIGIVEENAVLKDWYAANGFVHLGAKKFAYQPFTAGFMEWRVEASSEA